MKKLSLAIASLLNTATVFADPTENSPSTSKLEEVVVVASRVEAPVRQIGASVSVLNAEDLKLRGMNNIADILRSQTSITVSNVGGPGSQTALRIRGEEGFRTLILLDGIEISDPTGTQVGPKVEHLNHSSGIDRIEILRGPQGFIYGADAGGVISISTLDPTEGVSGQISADYGRYNTSSAHAHAAAGSETLSAFVAIDEFETEGFNAYTGDASADRDGYRNTTIHSKIRMRFADNLSAQLVQRQTQSRNQYDLTFGTAVPESEYDQRIQKLSLTYDNDFTTQSVAVMHTHIERARYQDGALSEAPNGEIHKLDYLGHYQFSDKTAVTAGAELETERVESGLPTPRDPDEARYERDQKSLFAELQHTLFDQVYLSAGLRFDDNEDFGEHTSGRLSLAYVQSLNNDIELKYRASAGSGFRAPSLYEIAYNKGTFAFGAAAAAVLAEETSHGGDLGLDVYFGNGASLLLTYFDQTIENAVFFDLVNFSGYLQDDGISHSRGFELGFDYPIAAWLNLLGNVTFNETEQADDSVRIRRPEKMANLSVLTNWLDDRLSVSLHLRHASDSENEIFGVGRVALDDYTVANLHATYAVTENFEIYGRVENAGDVNYEEVTNYNTAGSASYAGVRFKF